MSLNSSSNRAPAADMAWLGRYVGQHRQAAWLALICGAIGGATAALEPYLIGLVIDSLSQGVQLDEIVRDIAILIGLSLITVVAFWGQRRFSGDVAYGVNYDVRRDLYNNLLTLEQGFFQSYAVGDLISRMYSDIDAIWRLLALGLNRFGSAMLTVIVAFALLLATSPTLTLVMFTVLVISTSFQIRAGLYLSDSFERVQEQAGTVSALVQDSVSGILTVKTFGHESGVAQKFSQENQEYRRRWLYFKRRNEPVGMLPNMISQLMTGVVVLFGGVLAAQGSITLGNFAQFLVYLGLISNVLLQLGTIYQRYQQTKGALTRLTPLLASPTITDAPDAQALPQPRGEISFEDVSLTLEGTPILQDISLHIPAGQVVALVGPTGSGKTLLVSLLARVLDPTTGRVKVDGEDVRHWRLADLRHAIAYVPQSTFLFSQTLQNNIRMGRLDLSDDAVGYAVQSSRISNDLAQLPDGLETMVGEKGVMLSGGQKQRVAIARAIVRNPAILVLDDALSSVDTQTAAQILGDLRHVLRGRTSIVIAHRMATVRAADHIVVIDHGRIVEQGTHESLMALAGHYAKMVEREANHVAD